MNEESSQDPVKCE